nr:septum formation initiator family protein [Clostridia bacterium]
MGNKKHTALSFRVALVILLVGAFLLIGVFLMKYNEIAKEASELSDTLAALEEENARLKEEISAPWNEAYIKRVARRELGYCLPGEIIYFSDFED